MYERQRPSTEDLNSRLRGLTDYQLRPTPLVINTSGEWWPLGLYYFEKPSLLWLLKCSTLWLFFVCLFVFLFYHWHCPAGDTYNWMLSDAGVSISNRFLMVLVNGVSSAPFFTVCCLLIFNNIYESCPQKNPYITCLHSTCWILSRWPLYLQHAQIPLPLYSFFFCHLPGQLRHFGVTGDQPLLFPNI